MPTGHHVNVQMLEALCLREERHVGLASGKDGFERCRKGGEQWAEGVRLRGSEPRHRSDVPTTDDHQPTRDRRAEGVHHPPVAVIEDAFTLLCGSMPMSTPML
jgi:hypothetical protein